MNRVGKYILERSAEMLYFIAVRENDNFAFEDEKSVNFTVIKNPPKTWLADPIPFEKDGCTYLFYEAFPEETHRGYIGMMRYDVQEKKFKNHQVVLTEPFHMSFPHIFMFKNTVYMIPETNAVLQIRVYKAGKDLSDWKLHTAFDTKAGYSDIVTKVQGESVFVCCTEKGELPLTNRIHVFKIQNMNSDNPFLEEINLGNSEYKHNMRNGGSIFEYKGRTIRVIQRDDEGIYGSGIILRQVYTFDDTGFAESLDYKIIKRENIEVNLSKLIYEIKGVHTYSLTSDLEIIDIFAWKISMRKFLQHYCNLFRTIVFSGRRR